MGEHSIDDGDDMRIIEAVEIGFTHPFGAHQLVLSQQGKLVGNNRLFQTLQVTNGTDIQFPLFEQF